MLRVYQLTMFGETNHITEKFEDLNTQEIIVLSIISILVIVLGFFPNIIFELTNSSVFNTLQIALGITS
jgi:NADH-quinone oxidoreductase subunit M